MNLSDYSKYDIDRGIYYGHPKIVSPPPPEIFLNSSLFFADAISLNKGYFRINFKNDDSDRGIEILLLVVAFFFFSPLLLPLSAISPYIYISQNKDLCLQARIFIKESILQFVKDGKNNVVEPEIIVLYTCVISVDFLLDFSTKTNRSYSIFISTTVFCSN